MDKLIQMAVDTYYNSVPNFSQADANEALRKEILEITGGKTAIFELDPMQKHKLFDLIKDLSKKSAVQSVEPTQIDWQSEADLIKANSNK